MTLHYFSCDVIVRPSQGCSVEVVSPHYVCLLYPAWLESSSKFFKVFLDIFCGRFCLLLMVISVSDISNLGFLIISTCFPHIYCPGVTYCLWVCLLFPPHMLSMQCFWPVWTYSCALVSVVVNLVTDLVV